MGTIEELSTMPGDPIRTGPVDPSNAEQARAWDGDEGAYWAARAEAFDRSMAGYTDDLLAAAAVRPGDEVLDVGCGAGQVTRAAARSAEPGRATGIDLSGRMLEVARAAAAREGLDTVSFVRGDAQVHPFPTAGYDLVVSRTGTMFFGDPAAAFGNLRRALRPRGRLVLLVWQAADRTEWIGALLTALSAGRPVPVPPPDAPGPFSFGDPDRIRALLTGAGFGGSR